MRIMLKVFAGIFVVMALVVSGGGYSWAVSINVPMDVQMSLNLNVQEADSGTPPIVKHNTSNSTMHTSDLIKMIGTELGYNFSNKAKLSYGSSHGIFTVIDGPSISVDVTTTLLSMTFDNADVTIKGESNSDTGKNSHLRHLAATIVYGPDTAGNTFTFTGSVADNNTYNPGKSTLVVTRSIIISGFGHGITQVTKSMQITGGTIRMNGKVVENKAP